MPRLVKEIEKRVKVGLQKPWVPTAALFHGGRDCGEFYLQQSFGNCCPLRTESLTIPRSQEDSSDCKFFFCTILLLFSNGFIEDLKEYWARNLPDVTKQCHKDNLIASLLFKDNEFPKNILFEPKITRSSISSVEEASSENVSNQLTVQASEGTQEKPSKKDELLTEIQTEKEKIIAFQDEINFAVKRLEQVFFKFCIITFFFY